MPSTTEREDGADRPQEPEVVTNIKKLFGFIRSKWLLLLVVGLVAGIAGVVYSILQKPKYKSHLSFALDDSQGGGNLGNLLSLASEFGVGIGSGKEMFSGDNILEIMKSRRMVENVLLSRDTFDNKPYTMIGYYLEVSGEEKSNPKIRNIRFPVGVPRSAFSYQQDSLLYRTYLHFSKDNIIADRPDKKLGIYEVNVISPDEKFTKDFTDSLVAKTNDFYTEIRTRKAKETLDVLEQRASAMKANLNSSFANKASAQDVNVNPAFSEGQVPVQKQQANIQVYGAAYGEMFKDLELARFQYLNEIPLMQIIDQANYPMEKIKSGKLEMAIIFAFFAEMLVLVFFGIRSLFDTKNPA